MATAPAKNVRRTASEQAAHTAKWAVTMTKVGIRRGVATSPWPRWHIVNFVGRGGAESQGVVDLVAIRKDHRSPRAGTKRGDDLQLILIQVKGGAAPRPTSDDGKRLRAVARRHGARAVLLATWKKGTAAQFFTLSLKSKGTGREWTPLSDLRTVFG